MTWAIGFDGFRRFLERGVGDKALGGSLSEVSRRWMEFRTRRRWRHLRALGMKIGRQVNLPNSTWIDTAHCQLISIGDFCGFGDGCVLLAHDAMCNEWLDATRIAPLTIHESCHFGARTILLPGIEVGPRAIVGAGSVVTRSIPANSVAAGNPARVICSLDELLDRQRRRMRRAHRWSFEEMCAGVQNARFRKELREILRASGEGFVTGGMSATRQGHGNLVTPPDGASGGA